MKHLFPLLFLLLYAKQQPLHAQQAEVYHRAKVSLIERDILQLAQLGIETDHGQLAPGRFLISDFSESEIALMKKAGFDCEILIPDVSSYYADPKRNKETRAFAKSQNCQINGGDWGYETPEHYQDGSMGGYFTFAEMEAILDQMAAEYPNLITPKQIAGYSHEGRPIYWLRVSDNPNQDENEPEILYTALHHAREPNSLSQMIFYLWYLLEHYGSDPEIQYLLDNTEMYFMPCVNPDGYVYNETTNPNGGGLWRKNRWVSPDDNETYGVDLNRNYGYQWGYDDFGSSPNPQSNVFRGTAPFSEPETQAVRQLANQHQFQIALNYHTYGNLLIHPWGYNDQPTTEDDLFKSFGQAMTQDNDFLIGTGVETVGYIVNGDSDDWMYGEQTEKPRIFSMTPEVGPSFWPSASQIDDLNKSVMKQNLVAAHLLLNYAEAKEINSQAYLYEENGQIQILLKKYGLQAGSITFYAEALENYLAVNASAQTFSLNQLEEVALNIPFSISEDAEQGDPLTFVLHIDNGLWAYTDTLKKTYLPGDEEVLFSDQANDFSQWANQGWGITTEDFVSPPSSITDSPNELYGNDQNKFLLLTQPIALSEDALLAQLRFQTKWEIENNWDYVQVFAFTETGDTIPLCGKYTNSGTGNFQPTGQPLYDGTQNEWVQEVMDLSDFIGQEVQIAFLLRSDQYQQMDGFYFDDLEIVVIMPQPVSSTEVSLVSHMQLSPNPTGGNAHLSFQVKKAGPLQVRVYSAAGTEQFRLSANVEPGRNSISIPSAQLPVGMYFVRVKSKEGSRTLLLNKAF